MFSGVSRALYVLLGGAIVGYLVRQIIPTLITGTSVGENIHTYIMPFTIFVIVIVVAIKIVFSRKKPKNVI